MCKLIVLIHFIVMVVCKNANETTTMRKLPEGMKLGVASAAYQIEGAWNVADKSPSIWDTFCHLPNKIDDGTTGDDACKSYQYYKRDIEMIKFLGVDFYRFSISWPRILPKGFSHEISEDGVKYYNALIDELLANNIEPMVTMFHWDLPQCLQDLGGWSNPLISDWFEDYARVLFDTFGDRVKTWITINEPKQIAVYGYGQSRFAPGVNSHGFGEYLAAKHITMASAKAWHLYDKEYRSQQKGKIGITIATDFRTSLTDSPEDVQAGSDAMDFDVGLFAHPIFSETGGYPESVKRRIAQRSIEQGYSKSRLPEYTDEEIEYVKGTSDFYGFNLYSGRFYTRDNFIPGMYAIPSYDDDLGATWSYKDYKPAAIIHCTFNGIWDTSMGKRGRYKNYIHIAKKSDTYAKFTVKARESRFTIYIGKYNEIPESIRMALNWVKEKYNNPPIMITENGFGTFGGLQDTDRVRYLTNYIDSMLDAIEIDGVNVIAYTVWSLMDNFEWSSGLSIKFGIFETDYESEEKTRRPRSSAFWYRHLVATRTLDRDYKPVFEELEF